MDMTEEQLETQLREVQEKLNAVRAANRDAVLIEVKDKIKKYALTRTELASAFPVLRKPRTSSAKSANANGSVPKKRGRRSKAEIAAARAAEAATQQE